MNGKRFYNVIDDCGLEFADPFTKKITILLDNYNVLFKLAKKYKLKVPLAFTCELLDTNNILGQNKTLSYVNKLIKLIKQNEKYCEIMFHGLTHEYNGCAGEFYNISDNKTIPKKIQQDHIKNGLDILESIGFEKPNVFVAPYHAWELGVTDKILSEYGFKYIINDKLIRSDSINVLSRSGLKITAKDNIIKYHPRQIIMAIEGNYLLNLVRYKSFKSPIVHSYMTHIGNFNPETYKFWDSIYKYYYNENRLTKDFSCSLKG